jgi:uncharacterized Zn finger protein (UPF0148 family)
MDNQCTATAKSTGERCQRAAVKGATVCPVHGGMAEQVQEKAQERLDRMADETTAEMQDVIQDLIDLYNAAPPEDKVDIARELRQNWKAILDRTGHGPSETREVTGEGGSALEVVVERSEYDG